MCFGLRCKGPNAGSRSAWHSSWGTPAPDPPPREALQRERLALGVGWRLKHCLLTACAGAWRAGFSTSERSRWLADTACKCAVQTIKPFMLKAEKRPGSNLTWTMWQGNSLEASQINASTAVLPQGLLLTARRQAAQANKDQVRAPRQVRTQQGVQHHQRISKPQPFSLPLQQHHQSCAPSEAMEPRWWYLKATAGTRGERARACSFSSLARYLPCCSATCARTQVSLKS